MNWPDDFINKIICGDCLEVMKKMPENSIDAIVTDPPYGLEFMGKEWDKLWDKREFGIDEYSKKSYTCSDGSTRKTNPVSRKLNNPNYKAGIEAQLWHTQWLTEAYRVLKPGGSMLVMGGTRTFHRLACAIEDSGFIIKDTLMWLYGSGFPKAQDLGKMIDKRAKVERRIIGKNPHARPNSDGRTKAYSGIQGHDPNLSLSSTNLAKFWDGFKIGGIKPAYEPIIWAVKPPEGSYIDNVLKWGVGAINVDECRIEHNGNLTKGGCTKYGGMFGNNGKVDNPEGNPKGRFPANIILDEESARMMDEQSGDLKSGGGKTKRKNVGATFDFGRGYSREEVGDSGGASRFFYCAKASRSERGEKNKHPTVKPIALFLWLIQLITREEQLILDPFIGSGTTMLASQRCNRKYVGIEKDKEYCELAEKRLAQGVL